jgi:hypothetical protein
MCVSTGAPASSKTLVQDISYPVIYVDSAILIRFPKEKTKWTDISVIQNKQVKRNYLYHDQLWIIQFIFVLTRFGWQLSRFSYSWSYLHGLSIASPTTWIPMLGIAKILWRFGFFILLAYGHCPKVCVLFYLSLLVIP